MSAIRFILSFFVLLYLVFFISTVIPIVQFGIIPRTLEGMWGIFFAPFLHGSWMHLVHNSFPLLFLLCALVYLYRRNYFKILVMMTVGTNLLVWIFAGQGVHIGASGLIFALSTFHIVNAWKRKSFLQMGVVILIFLIYDGNIYRGLLPSSWSGWMTGDNISYSSHWYGTLVGLGMGLKLKSSS